MLYRIQKKMPSTKAGVECFIGLKRESHLKARIQCLKALKDDITFKGKG